MTRNTLLLSIITILFPAMLWAQAKTSIPSIDIGIKAGANFATLSGSTWDNGYKAGFLGGIFAGLHGAKMGVQAEAFFSQTSYTAQGHNFYDGYSAFYNNAMDSAKNGRFRVSYLSIPVLFEFKPIPFLWIQIGPQYNGVVSVKDVDGLVKDGKALFKSSDISGVVGLELKLPLHLSLGARYVLGLSSMNNLAGAWQQRLFQVHVGYSFL
ncbi:MAG: PorT family protein [Taibaiella sp.]|nr:PorT family protein [Taibaiella sp.]